MKNFRLFQTERVCRRQFQIKKNGRKLSKRVENTVWKGEIARYEQFLLFPQCFHKACFPGASKGVIVWEWVKATKRSMLFFNSGYTWWGIIMRSLTFSQLRNCFLWPIEITKRHIHVYWKIADKCFRDVTVFVHFSIFHWLPMREGLGG